MNFDRLLKVVLDLASISFWLSAGWDAHDWANSTQSWSVFAWSLISLALYWGSGLWLEIRAIRAKQALTSTITPEQVERAHKTLRGPEA